jgi:hypothetical protein
MSLFTAYRPLLPVYCVSFMYIHSLATYYVSYMYILSLFGTLNGTLFCLPLRTEEQAASSLLKTNKIKIKMEKVARSRLSKSVLREN